MRSYTAFLSHDTLENDVLAHLPAQDRLFGKAIIKYLLIHLPQANPTP